MSNYLSAALLLLVSLFWPPTAAAEAIHVTLTKTDDGWQLSRGGEPYFIKGAGGTGSLELLKAAGGNSIRTWGVEGAGDILDRAHELGLTVTVGIWLGHERHGFDYNDEDQVSEQLARAREAVLKFKDHPALLLWGIGNEMEGFEKGDNPAIWRAVNDVAAMVKELDPNHPTMVVTAEIGGARVDFVHNKSPAVDIHGINSYGGAPSIVERLKKAGGTKPYVFTEFGAMGAWEVAKTPWGAAIEQTSTAKADFYRKSYEQSVLGAKGQALGAYAFTWGFKMEATATWHGMFLSDGSKVGSVDVMTELWSGEPPADLSPQISKLVIEGRDQVKPKAKVRVASEVTDPEEGELSVRWVLRFESNEYLTGGDFRRDIPDIEGSLIKGDVEGAQFRMPDEPGAYRIFMYAKDAAGNSATANIPILVKGKVRPRMPIVYNEGFEGMPWAPSGWMGGVEHMSFDGESTENPFEGKVSAKLQYEGVFGWAGIAWQNPANNWGDQEGGFDITGASHLELWARGEYGGERVGFGVGIISKDKPHSDSHIAKVDNIVLTDKWRRYEVPLRNADLSSIKTGFVVTLSGRRTPVTIYLDNVRFVR